MSNNMQEHGSLCENTGEFGEVSTILHLIWREVYFYLLIFAWKHFINSF